MSAERQGFKTPDDVNLSLLHVSQKQLLIGLMNPMQPLKPFIE